MAPSATTPVKNPITPTSKPTTTTAALSSRKTPSNEPPTASKQPHPAPTQQQRTPSPPPQPPLTTSAPGPRATALTQIFTSALTHVTQSCSYTSFSSCFPTAARYNPALLESVWRQITGMLESRSRREFDDILAEKDVVRGLGELERVIEDARRRKNTSTGEETKDEGMRAWELGPRELYGAHLAPHLDPAKRTLEEELAALQADNETLMAELSAQEAEAESLLAGLESVVRDLERTNEVMTDAGIAGREGGDLRGQARDVDAEMKARSTAGEE